MTSLLLKNIYNNLKYNIPKKNLIKIHPEISLKFFEMFINAKYKTDCVFFDKISLELNVKADKLSLSVLELPKIKKCKFIVIFFSIYNIDIPGTEESQGHANLCIIDTKHKILEIYEPHGSQGPYVINEKLAHQMKCLISNILHIFLVEIRYPKSFGYGLQQLEDEEKKTKKDLPGYCLFWAFYFLENKVVRPEMAVCRIEYNIFKKLYKTKTNFKKFIRNYALDIYSRYFEIVSFLYTNFHHTRNQNINVVLNNYNFFVNCMLSSKCAIKIEKELNLYKNSLEYSKIIFKNLKVKYDIKVTTVDDEERFYWGDKNGEPSFPLVIIESANLNFKFIKYGIPEELLELVHFVIVKNLFNKKPSPLNLRRVSKTLNVDDYEKYKENRINN
uniref:Uncharacterized protein n=1 Tax=viral metagenome TaxID=1070528 RepID=A0A6C0JB01_9ZZZZ